MSKYRRESIGTTVAIYGGICSFIGGVAWGQGELVDGTYGSQKAREYAEQSGYKNVALQDIDKIFVGVRGCSESDAAQYEFTATAPNGAENIGIAVCKGLFKGATLRQK